MPLEPPAHPAEHRQRVLDIHDVGTLPALVQGMPRVHLSLGRLVRASEVEQLIDLLRRTDIQLSTLALDLSGDLPSDVLTRLLDAVETCHNRSALQRFGLLVNGSGHGPVPAPLRQALAGSRVSLLLSWSSVRSLLFNEDVATLLDGFVALLSESLTSGHMSVMWGPGEAVEHRMWEDDALLRAVATLSPGGQIEFSQCPPTAIEAERLSRAQAPYRLRLHLSGAHEVDALIDWLARPRPLLQAVTVCLPIHDQAICSALLKALMSQPSVQCGAIDAGVTLKWSPLNGPAMDVSMGSVSVDLGNGVALGSATELLSLCRPRHLALRALRCNTLLSFVEQLPPESLTTVRSLQIQLNVDEKLRDALYDELGQLLKCFGLLRVVSIETAGQPLDDKGRLEQLGKVLLERNPLLERFRLLDWALVSWPKPYHVQLGLSRIAYAQAGAQAFLRQHVVKETDDLARHIVEVGGLEPHDLLAMAMVSSQTHARGHAAQVEARAEATSQASRGRRPTC